MDEKRRIFWIAFGYIVMSVLFVAGAVYIIRSMKQQHSTFVELRAIRLLDENSEQAADSLVNRGARGLEYVLQELQQDHGKNPYFRLGRALEKAAGRFHEPLDKGRRPTEREQNTEKASIRKLINDARHKLMRYVDQAYYHERAPEGTYAQNVVFTPEEKQYLRQFIAVVRQYGNRELEHADRRLDTENCVRILQAVFDGKNTTIDDARFLENNFNSMIRRIDRCITGYPMVLLPEEIELMTLAAERIRKTPISDEADRYLEYALSGFDKLTGAIPAQATGPEIKSIENAIKSLSDLIPAAAVEDDRALLERVFQSEELKEKLEKWISYSRGKTHETVDFTPEEQKLLLDAADVFLVFYEKVQERFSEVALKQVENLVESGARLKIYDVLEDPELEAKASVFKIIGQLWRQTEDRVIIINMIDISGSENDQVRDNMLEALVTAGQAAGDTAIESLVRNIERKRIDQALAAATSNRTKDERLRELNEANKRVRIACTRVLTRVAPPEIVEEVIADMLDEEDPDIRDAAKQALQELEKRLR